MLHSVQHQANYFEKSPNRQQKIAGKYCVNQMFTETHVPGQGPESHDCSWDCMMMEEMFALLSYL